MDRLVAKISRGVGIKRKRSILVRLSSRHQQDDLLPSDDSSDEDYIVEPKKSSHTKPSASAKRKVNCPSATKKSKVSQTKRRLKRWKQEVDVSHQSNSKTSNIWGEAIPSEMLLRIFHAATDNNENRLRLLMRVSRVNRLWRQVASDSSLWKDLDLSYGWIISIPKALHFLKASQRLANLRHLCLKGSKRVTPKLIKMIVGEFPHLRSVDVSGCHMIKPEGIDIIATGLKSLVSFAGSGLLSIAFSMSLANLVEKHRSSLERLEVGAIRWTSPSLINNMASLTSIAVLDISGINVPATASCLKLLRSISPHLKVLRAASCSFNIRKSEDAESPIEWLQLTELSVAGMSCPGLKLQLLIGSAPRLQYLDLRGWKADSITALSQLSLTLPHLRSLNLATVSCDRHSTIDLSQFSRQLEQLDISRLSNMSDEAINHLISTIAIDGSPLKALHCAETAITPAQLTQILSKCKNMEALGLESCRSIARGSKRLYNNREEIAQLRGHFNIT